MSPVLGDNMSVLMETQRLKKYFPITGGVFKRRVGDVRAVDGVNIAIDRGECFSLVGESGCGKTTLGKTMIRLLDPTEGHIFFDVPEDIKNEISRLENSNGGQERLKALLHQYDLAKLKGKALRKMRRRMQIVYQDPTSSLNPRMLVKDIVGEPLIVHKISSGAEVEERVLQLLYKVGLTEDHMLRYPHEFSGGQRQRIAIARALATNPDFVVLDEPTSAIDVSVRAQILNLLQDLRRDFNLTYLFITHDLNVVRYIADKVAVMYLGKIVEMAEKKEMFRKTLHPYSRALLSSIPVPDPEAKRKRIVLSGEVPSPVNPPPGCRFEPRCPYAKERCKKEMPPLEEMKGGHFVACYYPLM